MIKSKQNDIVNSNNIDDETYIRNKAHNEPKKSNIIKSETVISNKNDIKSKEILHNTNNFSDNKALEYHYTNKVYAQGRSAYKSEANTEKEYALDNSLELEITKNSQLTEPFNVSTSNVEDPNESNKYHL